MPHLPSHCQVQPRNQYHDYSAVNANSVGASYTAPKENCIIEHLLDWVHASGMLEEGQSSTNLEIDLADP